MSKLPPSDRSLLTLPDLDQIASQLADQLEQSMSRQSMHDRFTEKSTAFLVAVYSDLLEQRYRPAHHAFSKQKLIKRVFTEDCSGLALPKSNAKIFPAHGNHHGDTAGVNIDFSYDLLTGEVISQSLEEATRLRIAPSAKRRLPRCLT